jgi:hypothetical protein
LEKPRNSTLLPEVHRLGFPGEQQELNGNAKQLRIAPLLYCNANGAFHAPIRAATRTVVWWGDRATIDRIP